jgi:hypothetical protein
MSFLLVIATIVVKIGMKDVVADRKKLQLENRVEGEEGQAEENKVTVGFILKQVWFLFTTEPLILLGIIGTVIQINMKIIGGTTTTLAL